MKEFVTRGIICLKDDYNFVYKIAEIDYVENENGEFQYYFYPNYYIIEMLDSSLFQGIPGLDLSQCYKCYSRENITPVFISERTPSENRVDLWEQLEENNMKSLNRLEWLIRTNTRYSGDRLYVEERSQIDDNPVINVKSMFDLTSKYDGLTKELLKIICRGGYLNCDEIIIDDDNREDYYNLLMPMYIKKYNSQKEKIKQGIEIAKANNLYKGRKRIKLDTLLLDKVVSEYTKGYITKEEALSRLNVSESTFYRRLKEELRKLLNKEKN